MKTDEHLYTLTRLEFAKTIGKSKEAVKIAKEEFDKVWQVQKAALKAVKERKKVLEEQKEDKEKEKDDDEDDDEEDKKEERARAAALARGPQSYLRCGAAARLQPRSQ